MYRKRVSSFSSCCDIEVTHLANAAYHRYIFTIQQQVSPGESVVSSKCEHQRTSYVVFTAVVCYDYCINFEREVEYVWKKQLSLVSILFYLYRYSVLFSMGLVILGTQPPLSWQAPHSHVSMREWTH